MLKVQNRVLSKNEIAKVAKYHKNWRRRDLPGPQLRFAIFRLSCCCALRCKEIVGVNLGDFFFDSESPFIRIRKDITKGHRKTGTVEVIRKPRKVSLKIDTTTRNDLKKWYDFRVKQSGGDMSAPFIAGQTDKNRGKRLCRPSAAAIWHTALRALGRDRARECSIHSGRHTCLSHMAWDGVPLVFIMKFAGHANIATTSHYLHTCDESEIVTDLFSENRRSHLQQKVDNLLTLLCLEAGEISEGEAAKAIGVSRVSLRKYRLNQILDYTCSHRRLSTPVAVA